MLRCVRVELCNFIYIIISAASWAKKHGCANNFLSDLCIQNWIYIQDPEYSGSKIKWKFSIIHGNGIIGVFFRCQKILLLPNTGLDSKVWVCVIYQYLYGHICFCKCKLFPLFPRVLWLWRIFWEFLINVITAADVFLFGQWR